MHARKLALCTWSMALLCAGCGGDGGTDPGDQVLLGRWQYTSTNVFALFGERLVSFLRSVGTPEADIGAAVEQAIDAVRGNGELFDPEQIITFRENGTWTDNRQDGGTWRTSGTALFIADLGTIRGEARYTYALSGDTLKLDLSMQEARRILSQSEAIDESALGIFNLLFTEDDTFAFALVRVR